MIKESTHIQETHGPKEPKTFISYIYIYIERERERERENFIKLVYCKIKYCQFVIYYQFSSKMYMDIRILVMGL